jgi:hypothetical protein
MSWSLIALLSLPGLLMGLLSVWGITRKREPYFWFVFTCIVAVLVARRAPDNFFMHGLYIGIGWGIANGLIQSLFFHNYLSANPTLRSGYQKVRIMPMRFFPLLTGPVIGLVTGLILGSICMLTHRVLGS